MALIASTLACGSAVTLESPKGQAEGGSGSGAGGTAAGGSVDCTGPGALLSFGGGGGRECTDDLLEVAGTFTGGPYGFTVDASPVSMSITGLTPAIPDGTLVRARYLCSSGYHGKDGHYLQIDNLPELDATPNPTEDGTRLWLAVAGGGEVQVAESFPFSVEKEIVCTLPHPANPDDGRIEVQQLSLSGTGFAVVAAPEETVAFDIARGEHTGAYQLHNVHTTHEIYPGGDGTYTLNFSITRTD